MRKAILLLLTSFWLVMNVLLVRSEFGSGKEIGGSVPVSMVWHTMLNAPDDSALAIVGQGERIGSLRWVPVLGEDTSGSSLHQQVTAPEGMVSALKNYRIETEGNLNTGPASRVRFAWNMTLSTNHHLQEFTARLGNRPATWQLKGNTSRNQLEVRHESYDKVVWEQAMSMDALRHPELLLAAASLGETSKSSASGLSISSLQALASSGVSEGSGSASFWERIQWRASHEWMRLGSSKVRVYRLDATLSQTIKASVLVSRVGEILKVTLPGDWVLINEAIEALPAS